MQFNKLNCPVMKLLTNPMNDKGFVLSVELPKKFDYSNEILGMLVNTPLDSKYSLCMIESLNGMEGVSYSEKQHKLLKALMSNLSATMFGFSIKYAAQYPKNVPTKDDPTVLIMHFSNSTLAKTELEYKVGDVIV